MIGVQLLAVVTGIGALYISFIYYKKHDFSKKELIGWAVIWLAMMMVAIFPHSVDFLVSSLGFIRAMDMIMVVAFIILFAFSFYHYLIIHRLEKKMEKIVRAMALNKIKDYEKN